MDESLASASPLRRQLRAASTVPVRVLAKADMDCTLEEVLASLPEMDAVLPDHGSEAPVARPVCVFSGWPPEKMLMAVRRLRQVEKPCMAAMAVPRAMQKKMKQLLEETHRSEMWEIQRIAKCFWPLNGMTWAGKLPGSGSS
ncbi:unnamed protein product [Durusdinium trenchii]|uniref:Uncharacterized protein n=1 Tax=Durusdinium trenchii TaxID=1381693 RepID=A0ABP0R7H4_9DINO